MFSTWLLIIFVWGGEGTATQTIEFKNQADCQKALEAVQGVQYPGFGTNWKPVRGVCVERKERN